MTLQRQRDCISGMVSAKEKERDREAFKKKRESTVTASNTAEDIQSASCLKKTLKRFLIIGLSIIIILFRILIFKDFFPTNILGSRNFFLFPYSNSIPNLKCKK